MEVSKKYPSLSKQEGFNLLLSIVAAALLIILTANYFDNRKRIVIEEKFITEATSFIDTQTKRLKKIIAREDLFNKLFMTGQFDRETSERMALLTELLKSDQSNSVEEEELAQQDKQDSNK